MDNYYKNYYKNDFRNFYITYIFILIILVVFLLMTLAGGTTKTHVLILFGAKVNPLIEAGQYWRLLTSIFIHIGFTHLLFNTYALYILGKYSEKIFGHGKLVMLFLVSGLSGSVLSYLMSPHLSAGASGAIFGLLGAIVIYGWNNQFLRSSGLITNLMVILGINLMLGMILPGLDNYAHLGGLIGGSSLGAVLRLFKL
ncbi:MAG: rhomboid family intramembrane serine protease [Gracilibacter sp. BRH_c7a]|nr:MAG: rhomboid family intramembrane serine protease [Gracilibacter sp. BRH_c7a]